MCPLCGGAGWLRQDVPIGDPRFGSPVECTCQAERRQRETQERLFRISRLGDQLRAMTFDSFLTEGIPYDAGVVNTTSFRSDIFRNLKRSLSIARAFADEPQSWLVLMGEYGCGKTHLAVAIANHRIAQGHSVLFQVVPDLLDHLRATFSPQATVTYDTLFEEVRSAPLLILDDLGAQSNSPWAEEKLFQIINHRYNPRLPTVVTTNVAPERLPPRLVSRMTDMGSTLWEVKAPDFRGGLSPAAPAAPRNANRQRPAGK